MSAWKSVHRECVFVPHRLLHRLYAHHSLLCATVLPCLTHPVWHTQRRAMSHVGLIRLSALLRPPHIPVSAPPVDTTTPSYTFAARELATLTHQAIGQRLHNFSRVRVQLAQRPLIHAHLSEVLRHRTPYLTAREVHNYTHLAHVYGFHELCLSIYHARRQRGCAKRSRAPVNGVRGEAQLSMGLSQYDAYKDTSEANDTDDYAGECVAGAAAEGYFGVGVFAVSDYVVDSAYALLRSAELLRLATHCRTQIMRSRRGGASSWSSAAALRVPNQQQHELHIPNQQESTELRPLPPPDAQADSSSREFMSEVSLLRALWRAMCLVEHFDAQEKRGHHGARGSAEQASHDAKMVYTRCVDSVLVHSTRGAAGAGAGASSATAPAGEEEPVRQNEQMPDDSVDGDGATHRWLGGMRHEAGRRCEPDRVPAWTVDSFGDHVRRLVRFDSSGDDGEMLYFQLCARTGLLAPPRFLPRDPNTTAYGIGGYDNEGQHESMAPCRDGSARDGMDRGSRTRHTPPDTTSFCTGGEVCAHGESAPPGEGGEGDVDRGDGTTPLAPRSFEAISRPCRTADRVRCVHEVALYFSTLIASCTTGMHVAAACRYFEAACAAHRRVIDTGVDSLLLPPRARGDVRFAHGASDRDESRARPGAAAAHRRGEKDESCGNRGGADARTVPHGSPTTTESMWCFPALPHAGVPAALTLITPTRMQFYDNLCYVTEFVLFKLLIVLHNSRENVLIITLARRVLDQRARAAAAATAARDSQYCVTPPVAGGVDRHGAILHSQWMPDSDPPPPPPPAAPPPPFSSVSTTSCDFYARAAMSLSLLVAPSASPSLSPSPLCPVMTATTLNISVWTLFLMAAGEVRAVDVAQAAYAEARRRLEACGGIDTAASRASASHHPHPHPHMCDAHHGRGNDDGGGGAPDDGRMPGRHGWCHLMQAALTALSRCQVGRFEEDYLAPARDQGWLDNLPEEFYLLCLLHDAHGSTTPAVGAHAVRERARQMRVPLTHAMVSRLLKLYLRVESNEMLPLYQEAVSQHGLFHPGWLDELLMWADRRRYVLTQSERAYILSEVARVYGGGGGAATASPSSDALATEQVVTVVNHTHDGNDPCAAAVPSSCGGSGRAKEEEQQEQATMRYLRALPSKVRTQYALLDYDYRTASREHFLTHGEPAPRAPRVKDSRLHFLMSKPEQLIRGVAAPLGSWRTGRHVHGDANARSGGYSSEACMRSDMLHGDMTAMCGTGLEGEGGGKESSALDALSVLPSMPHYADSIAGSSRSNHYTDEDDEACVGEHAEEVWQMALLRGGWALGDAARWARVHRLCRLSCNSGSGVIAAAAAAAGAQAQSSDVVACGAAEDDAATTRLEDEALRLYLTNMLEGLQRSCNGVV